MTYYALFHRTTGKLLVDCTNDMHTSEEWSTSGFLFADRDLAEACAANYRSLEFEPDCADVEVVEMVTRDHANELVTLAMTED